jgi:hypothetical protein
MKICYSIPFLLVFAFSCGKNNPDPSWLEVDKWTLQQNSNSQVPVGALSHNFTDVWVYIDGQVLGCFEAPFKIPVLKSGNTVIRLYPAVRNNGISATKKIYPFVSYFEVSANLEQNKTLSLHPVTKYTDNVKFWIEDFEDATSFKIENDPNSKAQITTNNSPSILKWGNYYGQVNLTQSDSTWVAYTSGEMYLPKNSEVYLEMDYYNTNSLETGLLAISSSEVKNNPNILLNQQVDSAVKWRKIYIDLRELVSNSTTAAYFKQSFKALLDGGDSNGLIILDNIKVVHF